MPLSKSYNLTASSITESVIAMTIIATCLAMAIMIYGTVLQSDHDVAFYKAQQKVKELFWETKQKQSIENEEYNFETYKIQKIVTKLTNNSGYKIDFIVTMNTSKQKYQYIVNF